MNLFTSLLVALAALVAVALLIVLPGWLRPTARLPAKRRRRLARLLPWYRRLDARRRDRLCRRTARVLAEVELIGADGHTLTESQRLAIAGQIGLLCLGAQPTETRLPAEIMVYAEETADAGDLPWCGVVEDIGELATGQAWQAARLHLAWPAVAAALKGAQENPIVRGLARLQDFSAPAHDSAGSQTWGDALDIQRRAIRADEPTLIPMANELDVGEFFGQAAEAFFQRGDALADAHPDLYAVLAAYFDFETAQRRPAGHHTPVMSSRS